MMYILKAMQLVAQRCEVTYDRKMRPAEEGRKTVAEMTQGID